MSTKTVVGSGEEAPCRQRPTLTRHPKDVDTALGDSPNVENNLEKLVVSWTRGLSSATTTQVRTQDRESPLFFNDCIVAGAPSPLEHSSMTP